MEPVAARAESIRDVGLVFSRLATEWARIVLLVGLDGPLLALVVNGDVFVEGMIRILQFQLLQLLCLPIELTTLRTSSLQ